MQLGSVPYAEASRCSSACAPRARPTLIPDTVLMLEHAPVYTRGRRSDPAELPLGQDWYARAGHRDRRRRPRRQGHLPRPRPARGLPDRRASPTSWPSSAARGARWSRRSPRRASTRAAARTTGRDFTGVWVGDRKIGSIGLHVSHGVTTHGLSLNVDNDLAPFEWIVPCGLGGVAMTSRGAARPARRPARGCPACASASPTGWPRRSAPASGSSPRARLERALPRALDRSAEPGPAPVKPRRRRADSKAAMDGPFASSSSPSPPSVPAMLAARARPRRRRARADARARLRAARRRPAAVRRAPRPPADRRRRPAGCGAASACTRPTASRRRATAILLAGPLAGDSLRGRRARWR